MEKEFIVETRPTGRERELTEGRTSEVSIIWSTANQQLRNLQRNHTAGFGTDSPG